MAQETMYPAIVNSPGTVLSAAITNSTTTISLVDATKLPTAPNLATIGILEDTETILYTGKSGNSLTGVTRGFQGTAKVWGAGTPVARMFTAYDYDTLKNNVTDTHADFEAHKADEATLAQLGHVKHATLSTTLNTTWSGSSAPFTKAQTVSGILATDTPIIDVVMSGTFATDEARQEAWGCIYRAVTSANTITFYATEKPTVSLPLQIKVVR
jgi:hypothetical protein